MVLSESCARLLSPPAASRSCTQPFSSVELEKLRSTQTSTVMCHVQPAVSPVQRYTTLSLPIQAQGILGEAVRQTLRARDGGAEHGVGVGRLNHGRDVGDVVRQDTRPRKTYA